MRSHRPGRLVAALIPLAILSLLAPSAPADEGMWVYNNLPKGLLKQKYGFEPTQEWADHIMHASVRFNSGGSGSFVSSTGLVLTNHHVAAETLQKISTGDNDYYRDGFYAAAKDKEAKSPDLELNALVSIEDVTARVNAAVKEGAAPAEAFAQRRAAIAEIENESKEKTGLRSDVVTLYQGGQYHLYRYKRYTDVRLVWAPEAATAFFGGDPDNFEYPRYDLDACIFRVYEDDKPAKIEHFLRWSQNGAADNELVFVSGHPGRTSRLFTTAALKFLRDRQVPLTLDYLRRQEILLQQFGYGGDEQTRKSRDELFSVQNSRKAYTGMIAGLQDPALFGAKIKAEKELIEKVNGDPALKQYTGAWQAIEAAKAEHAEVLSDYYLLELNRAFRSEFVRIARGLVRLAAEDKKPNADRLPEYRTSGRESLEQQLFSPAPIEADLEEALIADGLGYLVEQKGADDPLVQKILDGKSPIERAADLVANTKIKSVEERKRIAQGGQAAIDSSDDAMIRLAVLVDPAARAVRKRYEEKVDEVQRQAYAQIAKALFAIHGASMYPDATFTLRLSFGVVKGYDEGGKTVPPMTTLGGAYDHETLHGGKEPWKLPARWGEKKSKLNLQTPLNFVSTADIIGGNSGSPVVNRAGEVVGLIFDGNIQSLTADYVYSDVQSRAVSVHSSAIRECLKNLYDAESLANELGK